MTLCFQKDEGLWYGCLLLACFFVSDFGSISFPFPFPVPQAHSQAASALGRELAATLSLKLCWLAAVTYVSPCSFSSCSFSLGFLGVALQTQDCSYAH